MPLPRVRLGTTDLEVSRLCLGTMQFGWTADEAASFAVMDAYAAAGGNFIDTADVYSRWHEGNPGGVSEQIIGRWMQARGNRADMVVATKVRGPMWDGPDGEGLSRTHILKACDDSLRRLQVDTIDLYQCHSFDDKTPIEETLRAFEELIRAGKVRYIGLSNYPPPQLREAIAAATTVGVPIVSLQPHHSMVHRREYEAGLSGLCAESGMAVIPYSPLAGGFLTGKYIRGGEAVRSARANGIRQYFTDYGWAVIEAVRAVAARRGVSCAAVALAWELHVPGVTAPIVGANSPGQLAEQLPSAELELSAEELAALDAASAPFLRENSPGR